MKKWLFPLILIAVIAFWGFGKYNTIIEKKGVTEIKWADVESAYQRRMDLFDNIVEAVKAAANHEKSTLEAVIKARSEATKISIDPSNITPEQLAKFQKAQSGLAGVFNKLMMVHESYPDLKANQNFIEFQSQIEGTENRINTARNRYNQAAGEYKIYIERIPVNFIAKIGGFKTMPLFKGEEGSEKAPKLKGRF